MKIKNLCKDVRCHSRYRLVGDGEMTMPFYSFQLREFDNRTIRKTLRAVIHGSSEISLFVSRNSEYVLEGLEPWSGEWDAIAKIS